MKKVKLTKEQQAILNLAELIDLIPHNQYPAVKETLQIFGLEKIKREVRITEAQREG